MEMVDGESEWAFLPLLADELIVGKSSMGFEALVKVVGHENGPEMLFELLVSLVIVPIDRSVLKGPVHALNFLIGPSSVRSKSVALSSNLVVLSRAAP